MLGLLLTMWSLRADWAVEARRLTAGVYARREALARLKTEPDLDAHLRTALTEPGLFNASRYLALDVIGALRRRELLEDLFTLSADDESGFFYLTINGLVTREELPRTAALYRQRLPLRTTTPVARMILLDSLARMNVRLERREFDVLLPKATPEVKGALLAYAKKFRWPDLDARLLDSAQRRERAR